MEKVLQEGRGIKFRIIRSILNKGGIMEEQTEIVKSLRSDDRSFLIVEFTAIHFIMKHQSTYPTHQFPPIIFSVYEGGTKIAELSTADEAIKFIRFIIDRHNRCDSERNKNAGISPR